MLTSAKNKEQKIFYAHFRKLVIEVNFCAKFYLYTTCRRNVNLEVVVTSPETNVHKKAHEE